jgi:hypothetical protein
MGEAGQGRLLWLEKMVSMPGEVMSVMILIVMEGCG